MNVSDFRQDKPLLAQFGATGFQATELARGASILKRMISDGECTRFLSFTSNLMATGLRGIFTEMARRKLFDAVVTTGGSLDHDFIRSFADYGIASFKEDDVRLHRQGVNRLGNILINNKHYIRFEKEVQKMFREMNAEKNVWSPSEVAVGMGKRLSKDKSSFLGECFRQGIPVYCPGITDSALGLQLYYYKQDRPDFIIDAGGDMRQFATMILSARKTGALVLGGGISKHYAIASNLIRGGLDYSVYVTTASEFDGSLSGAAPREAKSWGKIREKASVAEVRGDATIILPLLFSLIQ